MGPVEYLVYTLLFLVLIGLIGIIGYYIYDNFQKNEEYKKDLTSDLNTNFVDINKNFDSTSANIVELHESNGKKINLLDERLLYSSNLFASNFADVRYNITENSNLFATSNTVVKGNFNTFNTNLNKYFEFNNNATPRTPFDNMNKKLFEHVTFGNHIPMLDLISKTTATAGLKINTDPAIPNNDLEICDKTGQKCFNISSDNDNLYIYPKGTARADAPFKIVAAAGTPGSKAYASINGAVASGGPGADGGAGGAVAGANAGKISASLSSLTTAISFTTTGATTGAGYIGHNATITYTGGGGTGLEIGDIVYTETGGIASATIKNSGTGYTQPPIVLIAGGTTPTQNPVRFYAIASATASTAATAVSSFTLATVPDTGAIASSLPLVTPNNGYYSSPTKLVNNVQTSIVTITNNPIRANATAVTNSTGVVQSITITNDTDNGFYYNGATTNDPTNATIVSIGGTNLEGKNITYTKTIENGIWKTITNISGAGNTGFTASQQSLPVVLSDPEQPSAGIATITPSITKGSITSLTLTSAGSKYYKPTISVSSANLVTPVAAAMPTLHKLS